MGRINQYPKANVINDSDTLLGVVGGTTMQVAKDVLLSGVTNDIDNTTIVGKKAGKVVTADDSSNNRLPAITAYGKSVQNTYKGINLVDLSTPTLLDKVTNYTFDNKTGLVKFDYNGNYARAHFRDDTLAGKTLYLYLKNKTNTNASATVSGVDIMYKKAGESNFSYFTMNQPQYIIPSDATEITIRVLGNNSNTALSGTFSANIMISSEPTDTYEPFVGGEPSPNPSFPQVITSVADDKSLVIKSVGKNWLENTATTHTFNGITFTVNDDKSVTASGTAITTTSAYCYLNKNLKLPNGTYILSGRYSDKFAITIHRTFNDGTESYLNTLTKDNLEFSIDDNVNKVDVYLYIQAGATIPNVTIYPMIRLADIEDDTYEPYISTEVSLTLTDSLRGIPVTEGGNYTDENGQSWICDTIEKYADGTGKYIQRIESKVLTSADIWKVENTYVSVGASASAKIDHIVKDDIRQPMVMSNRAIGVCYNNRAIDIDIYRVYGATGGSNNIAFRYPASVGEITIEQARADFEGTEVIYALAEHIETDLTASQMAELEKLMSFNPYTTVSTDDIGEIAITYFKNSDSGKIVGSLNDRISNLVALLQSNGVI